MAVEGELSPEALLYSESPGRFIVTVAPEREAQFIDLAEGAVVHQLGRVILAPNLVITDHGRPLIDLGLNDIKAAFTRLFGGLR